MVAFDLRSLDVPIVQAGMGGVAWHELAAAVSEADGLGTIGGVRAPIANELAAARRLTGRPIAVNLPLPFVGRGDAEAAVQVPVLAAGGIVDAGDVRIEDIRPAAVLVRALVP